MLKNHQIEQYIKKDYPSYRIKQVKHLENVNIIKRKGFFKITETEKIYGFANMSRIVVKWGYHEKI